MREITDAEAKSLRAERMRKAMGAGAGAGPGRPGRQLPKGYKPRAVSSTNILSNLTCMWFQVLNTLLLTVILHHSGRRWT